MLLAIRSSGKFAFCFALLKGKRKEESEVRINIGIFLLVRKTTLFILKNHPIYP